MLCRQMLSEFGGPQLRFVLFTAAGERAYLLEDLYPAPPRYRGVRGSDVVAHAQSFAARCAEIDTAPWLTTRVASVLASGGVRAVYDAAVEAARRRDGKDAVYALRFAAGAWRLLLRAQSCPCACVSAVARCASDAPRRVDV
jgi:hypothetical protein